MIMEDCRLVVMKLRIKLVPGFTTDVMFATGTVNPVTISEDDVWRIAYQNIRRVNVFFKYADGSRNG